MRVIHLLFILLSVSVVNAQTGAWTQFNSSNSPLPFNSVRCIEFEEDSIVWIGTDFGLARYTSGNWTIYNSSNSSLNSNDIRSIIIDRNGNKWIGTSTAGLYMYNDTVWTNYNSINSPLPDDYVKSLACDTANSIWIGTLGGLARLAPQGSWTVYTMWNSVLGSNNIACIYTDTITNDKWAGTVNGGVLLIEKDTNLSSFTIQNSGISDNTILGIDRDASGNTFMVSPANGLIVKLGTFGWITYNTISSSIPTAGLTSIALDSIYEPWIGTNDKGLLKKSANTFIIYDSTNSPLYDPNIQCLKTDNQGRIWIGTQIAGIFILDPAFTTASDEIQSIDNINAYPNPFSETITITSSEKIEGIEIVNMDGRCIAKPNTASNIVNTTFLEKGAYFLRLRLVDGRTKVKRIIKN